MSTSDTQTRVMNTIDYRLITNLVQYLMFSRSRGFYAIATTFFFTVQRYALRVQRPINGSKRIFLIRSSGMVTRITNAKDRGAIKLITKRYGV